MSTGDMRAPASAGPGPTRRFDRALVRAPLLPLGMTAVAIVALAIYAAARDFSPVPFLDMWNGYLGFFVAQADGDTAVWWSQHNEHRLLTPRLLFWLDIRWLHGLGLLPLVLIHVGSLAMALLLWGAAIRLNHVRAWTAGSCLVGFALVAWFFLGAQYENQRWPFQICFTLAQLLPMCAMLLLWRSTTRGSAVDFAAACVAGVASVGTLATGLLILPLMVVFLATTRQGAVRIGIAGALFVASACLYARGFASVTVPGHDSPLASLLHHPAAVARFLLFYIGSPIEFLVRPGFVDAHVAGYAGLLFCALAFGVLVDVAVFDRANRLRLALLTMLAYCVGSGLLVACGRVTVGENGAMVSRYTTATLTAWAVLVVLASPRIRRVAVAFPLFAVCVATLGFATMLRLQLWSVAWGSYEPAEQALSGLALAMHVDDDATLVSTFPRVGELREIASRAQAAGLSFFSIVPYRDADRLLGSTYAGGDADRCRGATVATTPLATDAAHLRIRGSFVDRRATPSSWLTIVDARGRIVGFAVDGFERAILFQPRAIDGRRTYRGYVDRRLADPSDALIVAAPGCAG